VRAGLAASHRCVRELKQRVQANESECVSVAEKARERAKESEAERAREGIRACHREQGFCICSNLINLSTSSTKEKKNLEIDIIITVSTFRFL